MLVFHFKSLHGFASSIKMYSFCKSFLKRILVPIVFVKLVEILIPGNKFQDVTNVASEDWQIVSGIPEKLYVYSAHYEYLKGIARVRVIGATLPFSKRKVYCQLFDEYGTFYKTHPGIIQTSKHPSHELPYSPVYIFCPLFELTKLPKFVSISTQRSNEARLKPSNLLQISYKSEDDAKIEFGACVQPTYDYEAPLQLLQWMEHQILMGVEHFTFYNISIGPKTSCVMKSYGDTKVKVLPWSVDPLPELHNNGQVVQVNDCVLRYKGVSKYLVMLDFDEYILPDPTLAKNYKELIKLCHTHSKTVNVKQPVQFQFRSGLFGLGFPEFDDANIESTQEKNPESEEGITLSDLNLYKNVIRLKHIKPFNYRSKFLTTPELVTEPGIHSLVDADGTELYVPETIAYVHHYRRCNWASDCSGKETIEDTTGHFYAKELLDRVKIKIKSLETQCGFTLRDFK